MVRKIKRMGKKAEAMNQIVVIVLALIVIALMAFLAYKYILGTGGKIGALTQCSAQGTGSSCVAGAAQCTDGQILNFECPAGQVCCVRGKNST